MFHLFSLVVQVDDGDHGLDLDFPIDSDDDDIETEEAEPSGVLEEAEPRQKRPRQSGTGRSQNEGFKWGAFTFRYRKTGGSVYNILHMPVS